MTSFDIQKKYIGKINSLDLEILIAHAIKKSREFVLSHPEFELSSSHELRVTSCASRRIGGEPIAYIISEKEFYGLNFKVNKYTLIPRPETEQIVELVTHDLKRESIQDMRYTICDIGTGSGNIIISIASALDSRLRGNDISFFATDISSEALKIAKENAKKNNVNEKIKFLNGNLLTPIIDNFNRYALYDTQFVILANLPYLSEEIYNSSSADVKDYEPKTALFSENEGLAHYEELFKQIRLLVTSYELRVTSLLEISPEQKAPLEKLIKKYFPEIKPEFKKDLAGKWRICQISL